jgi:hypothetical protein
MLENSRLNAALRDIEFIQNAHNPPPKSFTVIRGSPHICRQREPLSNFTKFINDMISLLLNKLTIKLIQKEN